MVFQISESTIELLFKKQIRYLLV